MSDISREHYGSVATRLQELDAEISRAVERARRRALVGLVAAVAVTLITAVYLYLSYAKFAEVDPQFAMRYTEQRLLDYMPEAERQLRQSLHDQEDELIARAETRLKVLPDQLSEQAKVNLAKAIDDHMPDLEQQIYITLKDTLSKEVAPQPGGDPETLFRKTMADLAETVDQQVKTVYKDYLLAAGDPVRYLDELAEAKNLDHRQQLQREMLQSFFLLARQHDAQGADSSAATRPAGNL